ncbi:hypothetical protein XENOCAPTIV_020459 [Xenoophorus captivus]|uniref:Uncharacterized protein n=1 Tax=Xenoophorus captivus TaxID=1517983 RepID=A0ABV0QAV2_9TELE
MISSPWLSERRWRCSQQSPASQAPRPGPRSGDREPQLKHGEPGSKQPNWSDCQKAEGGCREGNRSNFLRRIQMQPERKSHMTRDDEEDYSSGLPGPTPTPSSSRAHYVTLRIS